jgi:tetratricopeptide (TPR) repeat protein
MYRKALEIIARLRNVEGMASNHNNLGNVLVNRDDLKGAEEMYRRALESDERLGRLEGIAVSGRNLGNVLKVQGDLNGAELMFRKALKAAEQFGSNELIESATSQLRSLHDPVVQLPAEKKSEP